MMNEDILILNEDKQRVYSIKENEFKNYSGRSGSIKRILILDNNIELRVITTPIVSQKKLTPIILNSLKRYSARKINLDSVDYKIFDKNNNKYTVLVFIKHIDIPDIYKNIKIFSIYNIVESLYENEEINDNAIFLIKFDDTYFAYYFKNGVFLKRSVYFENDCELLNNRDVYFIPFFEESSDLDKCKVIPKDTVFKTLVGLKKGLFYQADFKNLIIRGILGTIIFFLFIIFSQTYCNYLKTNEKLLIKELENKQKILKEALGQKKLSDSLYKEYLQLLSKKSDVFYLFNVLYHFGDNNIELDSLSMQGNKVSITGSCSDYILLERNLRKSNSFKEIRFNVTQNKGKNIFRIEGVFVSDRKK